MNISCLNSHNICMKKRIKNNYFYEDLKRIDEKESCFNDFSVSEEKKS